MAAARTTKARTAKIRLLLDSIEISNERLSICRSEPCAVGHHARDDRSPLCRIVLSRCGCQLVALLAIPLKARGAVGAAPRLARVSSRRPAISRTRREKRGHRLDLVGHDLRAAADHEVDRVLPLFRGLLVDLQHPDEGRVTRGAGLRHHLPPACYPRLLAALGAGGGR